MNIQEYIRKWFVKEDELRSSIAEILNECDVSANSVSPEIAKTLYMLVKISGAKRILEIGTLGGYSTIWLAKALENDGLVNSIELIPSLSKLAKINAENEGVGNLISFRVGHALKVLEELAQIGEKFDFVFIDADKENYPNYLNRVLEMLNPNALIVADNVLWRERIFDPKDQEKSTVGIRNFNEMVAKNEKLDSMLLTVGDGLIVARLK